MVQLSYNLFVKIVDGRLKCIQTIFTFCQKYEASSRQGTSMLNESEINKKRKPMLDNRAVPDQVNIAEYMIFPKIKATGEVEGDGAIFPYFLEVKMYLLRCFSFQEYRR